MLTVSREIIQVDPDVMSSQPVFPHTRVLIQSFFDYLETGETIFSFLKGFSNSRRKTNLRITYLFKNNSIKRADYLKVLIDESLPEQL